MQSLAVVQIPKANTPDGDSNVAIQRYTLRIYDRDSHVCPRVIDKGDDTRSCPSMKLAIERHGQRPLLKRAMSASHGGGAQHGEVIHNRRRDGWLACKLAQHAAQVDKPCAIHSH